MVSVALWVPLCVLVISLYHKWKSKDKLYWECLQNIHQEPVVTSPGLNNRTVFTITARKQNCRIQLGINTEGSVKGAHRTKCTPEHSGSTLCVFIAHSWHCICMNFDQYDKTKTTQMTTEHAHIYTHGRVKEMRKDKELCCVSSKRVRL